MRVVLGVGGGIAAYKAVMLLRHFTESGRDVTVVPTAAALNFVGAPTWEALSGKPVHTDVWSEVPHVPHVRLGQEADLIVVAPATADLLAKAAHGLADDLLTNTLLTARCPVVMAPAMHTEMWLHPATQANVATLRSRGVHVITPASGRLTGADTGPGRLPEPEVIFTEALAAYAAARQAPAHDPIANPATLAGRSVLITAGGTREALDPVRYLGNRSSGKMGFELARAAAERGARVTLVTTTTPPEWAAALADVVLVESALQMREAVLLRATADIVVMAAAVADFRPAQIADTKIKKTHGDDSAPTITLVRNPDILAELTQQRDAREGDARRQVLVGFAAETGDADGDVLFHARKKLDRKGCDLLVANEVGDGITFGQDQSTVYVLNRRRDDAGSPVRGDDTIDVTKIGPALKSHIAAAILDHAAQILPAH